MTAVPNRPYGRYHNSGFDLGACKLPFVAAARHGSDIEVQTLGRIADGFELDFTKLFVADAPTGVVVAFGFDHPQAAIVKGIA